MRSRRLPLALVVLPILLLGGTLALLWFTVGGGTAVRATVVEWLTGETPPARIDAYVQAVLRGDAAAAERSWEVPDWDLPQGRTAALQERRSRVTQELLAAGLQRDYLLLDTEWWRTCCEPGPICNSREAGGARVRVQFLDREGRPLSYTFDLFTRGGAYWGGAMGYPARQWALRDVYPDGAEPLFWRWVNEPAVRSLDAVRPEQPQ